MRIAIIGHSYHKITKSGDFFYDILCQIGSVQRFYDESWCAGPNNWRTEFRESDHDLIVIWQVHEAFSALSGKHENVVFVPMYDAMFVGSDFYWREDFARAKCVSFSRKLHQQIRGKEGESRYFKYFPDPAQHDTISDFANIRPFFWYRNEKIQAKTIFDLCGNARIEKFTLHNAPDPGEAILSIPKLPPNIPKIEVTSWFENAEHYRKTLLEHNLFYAPRPLEGIGMGFLEAMASGLCVVAPNSSTMNEYIANGTNGLLYAPERKSTLDFSRVREIGARARETVERGFEDWQRDLPRLIDYIVTPKQRLQTMRPRYDPSLRKPAAPTTSDKISVVTVCLNAANSLEATITSVLGQDRSNVEYVILDGGSTDGTAAIIEKYAPHLAYWQSKPDEGVYHAMNAAIDHCSGNWVLFMNAGDTFVEPCSLSRMFRSIPNGVDVIYGHHLYVPTGGYEEYHPAADFETTWSRLLSGDLWFDWLAGIPGHQATAVRRALLDDLRFDTTYRIAADHDLLFRARKGDAKFFNCDELVSIYVGGGMSAQNYTLCKQEWARIGRTYGDPAAAERFYAQLEEAERRDAPEARRALSKSAVQALKLQLKSSLLGYQQAVWNFVSGTQTAPASSIKSSKQPVESEKR